MSDIKFDGDWVIVEGNWLKARTLDLMLDAPSRRSNNVGTRRALVHDYGDALTVNYNSDYPGGVRIKGKVAIDTITGQKQTFNVEDIILDSPTRRSTQAGVRRALVHDFNDGLTINWASDYPGGVTINGQVQVPAKLTLAGIDVLEVLHSLEQKIEDLEGRIARLEG